LGASASFLINTNLLFCYNVFDISERAIYLSVTSSMNIFGGGIGNIIPIRFVSTKK